MLKRFQGMVVGFLAAIIFTGTMAYAATGEQGAKIFYNNIKIFIDGAQYVAKDVNGKVIEPFTMNGTTYLPVRAIATAFGKDVIWDGKTASVFLGKKDQNQPDHYLDRIQYSYFASGYERNKFYKINGTITDYLKNDYTNGILLYDEYTYPVEEDKDGAHIVIDYPLNSEYQKLNGKIVLPKKVDIAGSKEDNIDNDKAVDVLFYADDKLIHKAYNVTNTMPFTFSLDIKGVNKLTIKTTGDTYYSYIALTDLALYK